MGKFHAEIQLLKIRAARHQVKVGQTDDEMNKFLESNFTGDTLLNLKEQWRKECQDEESKSLKRWESKQLWMEDYEKNFKNNDFIKPKKQASQNQHNQRENTTNTRRYSKLHASANGTRRIQPNQSNRVHENRCSSQQDTRNNYRQNLANTTTARNTTPTTQERRPSPAPHRTYASVTAHGRQHQRQETVVNSRNYQPQPQSNNNRKRNHFFGIHENQNHPPNLTNYQGRSDPPNKRAQQQTTHRRQSQR